MLQTNLLSWLFLSSPGWHRGFFSYFLRACSLYHGVIFSIKTCRGVSAFPGGHHLIIALSLSSSKSGSSFSHDSSQRALTGRVPAQYCRFRRWPDSVRQILPSCVSPLAAVRCFPTILALAFARLLACAVRRVGTTGAIGCGNCLCSLIDGLIGALHESPATPD